MKLKSLVAATIAGMLATSLSYAAAPTDGLNDDTGSAMPSSTQQGAAPAENIGATPGANNLAMNNSNPMGDNSLAPSDGFSSNSNDDMSADTATGDDDY